MRFVLVSGGEPRCERRGGRIVQCRPSFGSNSPGDSVLPIVLRGIGCAGTREEELTPWAHPYFQRRMSTSGTPCPPRLNFQSRRLRSQGMIMSGTGTLPSGPFSSTRRVVAATTPLSHAQRRSSYRANC